jgi:WD40 repeat protein
MGRGFRSIALSVTVLAVLPVTFAPPARAETAGPAVTVVLRTGHFSSIRAVAFSSDGKRIVSGGYDQRLRIWDAASGAPLWELTGHEGELRSVAFSPDEHRAASASKDKTVRLWDADAGKPLQTLTGHVDAVNSVAFSLDGALVLSASEDGTAKLWNATTGALVRTFSDHGAAVTAAVFARDGKSVFSASREKAVRQWDPKTGKVARTFTAENALTSVAVSPDGAYVAAGARGQEQIQGQNARISATFVYVWDARTGRLLHTLKGSNWNAGTDLVPIVFLPDSARLLVGGTNLKLFDVKSGKLLRDIETANDNKIEAVAISADGSRVATGDIDINAAVTVRDTKDWKTTLTIKRETSRTTSLAFSSDGSRVAAGSTDGTVKLWDAASGQFVKALKMGGLVGAVAFSRDGKRVAAAQESGGNAMVFDVASAAALRTLNTYFPYQIALSPDGSRVLVAESSNKAELWDAATGKVIRTYPANDNVESVAFSPDGARVLAGGRDKIARLFETETGKLLHTLAGHESVICAVAFSSDGKRVLTGSGDNARLWDAASGKLLRTFAGAPSALVASRNGGELVLAQGADKTAKLYDAADGHLVRSYAAWNAMQPLTCDGPLAVSPDGARALSGDGEGTVRFWGVQGGSLLATLVGSAKGEWIAFTPDGFYDASANGADLAFFMHNGAPLASGAADKALHRPDLLREAIAGDPQGKVKAAAAGLTFR